MAALRPSRLLTPLASAALLAATPLLAQASVQTLSGQYLNVSYDTANLPTDFSNVKLVESPLAWNCTASACALAGSPTVTLSFGTSQGAPVSATTLNTMLSFSTAVTAGATVVDPLGNSWAIGANKFYWQFGVDIAAQVAPTNAQFATSLGQVKNQVSALPSDNAGTSVVVPWTGVGLGFDWALPGAILSGSATYLDLAQSGVVNWGPGASGLVPSDADQQATRYNELWQFGSTLQSAYYALPSITDPQCSSMSCMRFAYGTTLVNGYTFQMMLTPTALTSGASAVPEAGTGTLTMLGLGLVAFGLRRRNARA